MRNQLEVALPYRSDEYAKRLAAFIAQLIREGVAFGVENFDQDTVVVTFSGGY